MHALLAQRGHAADAGRLESTIRQICAPLRGQMDEVETRISETPHPFPREAGPVALLKALDLAEPASTDTPTYLSQRAWAQVEGLARLHQRALARLMEIAEEVEARI